MSKIIFTRPEDGGVSIVVPASNTATDALASTTVPDGVEYQIVDRQFVFPTDRLFRDAWTWGGKGHPILEDVEKSKVIACTRARAETRSAIKIIIDDELFGDPVVRTTDQLKTACSDVTEQINAANTTYEVKVLMTTYCGDPLPELPRDEQLRIAAEEAKERLKAKLEEFKEARIGEIQGKAVLQ